MEDLEDLATINFIYNDIMKIIRFYSDRTSKEVLIHCHKLLKTKTKSIIFELDEYRFHGRSFF